MTALRALCGPDKWSKKTSFVFRVLYDGPCRRVDHLEPSNKVYADVLQTRLPQHESLRLSINEYLMYKRASINVCSLSEISQSRNPIPLITVHASNPGFVAKMNTSEEVGSYLTYFFAKKVTENAKKGQNKELADIMDEIEMKLHDTGKQQIRMEFFTQTRKLRIKRNETDVNVAV